MQILRDNCKHSSIGKVAAQLELSRPALSMALNGKYGARTDTIEALVLAKLKPVETVAAKPAPTVSEPAWLAALRAEVARTTGELTARRLNCSPATVSQVLSGKYKANTLRIERHVRGVLLGEVVKCQANAAFLSDMRMDVCQEIQERTEALARGSFRYPVWLACRGREDRGATTVCPHFNCGAKRPAKPASNPSSNPAPSTPKTGGNP